MDNVINLNDYRKPAPEDNAGIEWLIDLLQWAPLDPADWSGELREQISEAINEALGDVISWPKGGLTGPEKVQRLLNMLQTGNRDREKVIDALDDVREFTRDPLFTFSTQS